MIYGHRHLDRDLALACDLCVIGSGAGGAPVAWEAARAGKSVVVLEAGSLVTPLEMSQLEHDMLPRLYHDAGGRMTANKEVHVHQGKGVGGSTLHNLNLVKRVPERLLDEWREDYGLGDALAPATVDALYREVEERLSVSALDASHLNGNNRVFKRGVEALGWRGGFLSHNRRGCQRSGFCELGCPFDAKENALKVFLADAVERGAATVLADTWATKVEWSGRRASGVRASVRDPATGAVKAEVQVDARAVCVSASATGTPALLRRSGVPDPHQLVGTRLHLHPGAAVAGVFAEELSSWIGIPQSYECTEHLDFAKGSADRIWIIAAFAHPSGVSSMLRAFGDEHARLLALYPRLAALSPMLHDASVGRVSPTRSRFGVRIDYWLGADDRAALARGLLASARILRAAGAERVIVPFSRPLELGPADDLDRAFASVEIRRHDLALTAVHPMSSAWMSRDPARGVVDPHGRYHWLENLFVSDTSLYPTSIGVPPQLTAYALGLHVGRRVAASL